ncbi:MAG: hypothetical protein GY865_13640, partial [candidate division Zixibacteria bacterium]|nr:hypothetical protein [candidate division Zixibacteria bacterium]
MSEYLAGWYIFTDSYSLVSIGSAKITSVLDYYTFYNSMADGATIGEAFMNEYSYFSAGGYDDYEVALLYGMTLFGDPTLKPRDRRPVELQEAKLPHCLRNRNYSFYFDADGGSAPPYYWNIISGQLPNGLTLYETEGRIAGQPTESGLFNFTIVAEDMCRKLPPNDESVFADTMEYSIGIVGVCGDANNSGLMDMDDVTDIIDYLFDDGLNMCPVEAGDMDQFDGTNINDAFYLYEYVAHMAVYPKCPPFTGMIPSAPENVIEIRNSTVQPERDKYRVDFWINSLSSAKSISIPFEYSCATSPVVCDSITFAGSAYSLYLHKYGKVDATEPKAVIGIANIGETAPLTNPARIASAWFSINSSTEEQLININSTSYGPNEFIIASPFPTTPYIPSIAIIPGLSFECGDATDNGVVDILDIVFLINYKYKSGPAPAIPESANINGDTEIDILDIVFLINFLYKSGAEP